MIKSIELPEPHTKLYSIENEGDHTASLIVKKEHPVPAFFTVAETIQLMKRYSHLTYIAVQASRSADRCDRENKTRGIAKYIRLMLKADTQLRELESRMRDWSKVER